MKDIRVNYFIFIREVILIFMIIIREEYFYIEEILIERKEYDLIGIARFGFFGNEKVGLLGFRERGRRGVRIAKGAIWGGRGDR
jgi:hypothetical protein